MNSSIVKKLTAFLPLSDNTINALAHVIKRTKEFNDDYFPYKVDKLMIFGSSIRTEEPKDLDLIVVLNEKDTKILNEWENFRNIMLNSNRLFMNLVRKINESGRRANISLIINLYRDELIKLGLKERWIDRWLPWYRVSDIRFYSSLGLPYVFVDITTIVRRYLTHKWRKRFPIQITEVCISKEKNS